MLKTPDWLNLKLRKTKSSVLSLQTVEPLSWITYYAALGADCSGQYKFQPRTAHLCSSRETRCWLTLQLLDRHVPAPSHGIKNSDRFQSSGLCWLQLFAANRSSTERKQNTNTKYPDLVCMAFSRLIVPATSVFVVDSPRDEEPVKQLPWAENWWWQDSQLSQQGKWGSCHQ